MEKYPASKGTTDKPELIKSYTRDIGRTGKMLADFYNDQPDELKATPDELKMAEVAVLRLYTGPWWVLESNLSRMLSWHPRPVNPTSSQVQGD